MSRRGGAMLYLFTTMLHTGDDPFEAQLQQSQLRWVVSSTAGATGLAENYAGLPL